MGNTLPLTPGWQNVHIGFENAPVSIEGVNPWNHSWVSLRADPIVVAHPSYPNQRHSAMAYEITQSEKRVVFAAAELSNGVWGFYVPVNGSNS